MRKYDVEVNGIIFGGIAFLVAAPFADSPWVCVGMGALVVVLSISVRPKSVQPKESTKEKN